VITVLDVTCPTCDHVPGVPCDQEPGRPPFFHKRRSTKAERYDAAVKTLSLDEQGRVTVVTDYEWIDRSDYWDLTFYCDFCKRTHHHGGGGDPAEVDFGPRSAHCPEHDSPIRDLTLNLVPGRDLAKEEA